MPFTGILDAQNVGQVNAETAPNNQNGEAPKEREERLRQLRIRAQQSDIATASYLELQQLARELGLNANQPIKTLRNALYEAMGITPKEAESKDETPSDAPSSGKSANGSDLLIRIEAAERARAFSVERTEGETEDYFTISGGVRVFIEDQREGYEHRISADRISLNRNQNTIRAEGNVRYIQRKLAKSDGGAQSQNAKEIKDNSEEFRGDSLIFRLRVWRGVIFYGIFSRNQTAETPRPADINPSASNPEKTKSDPNARSTNDKESILGTTVLGETDIRYYFDGEKMRKGSDEVLVLENGSISTSEREQNRYFGLKFHRLWIFGKPEWAMLSATLYVGHIPVLYLPYYYYNENRLFFHPVFGIREAYGEFVQTTSYLLGQPKSSSTDSLSFLPVNPGTSKDSRFKLEGLYLVPENEDNEKENKTSKKKRKHLKLGNYLKFLLDYYSYIGLFTGFEGLLQDLGGLKNLEISATLAYAHAIEERTGAGFATGKPFILDDDGRYRLKVIESSFFGQKIPFRYGIDSKLRTKKDLLSFDFQYYSDPFYRRDYFNRKENFDWLGYGLERAQRDSDNLLEEWRKQNVQISSLKWQVGLKLNPSLSTTAISSLDFRAFTSAHFSKRTDNQIPLYDPTREFFYPTKLFMPDTSLNISGTIWPPNERNQNDEELPVLQDWKYDPQSKQTDKSSLEDKNGKQEGILARPEKLENLSVEQPPKALSFEARYDLALQNLLQTETDNAKWKRAQDIELNPKELQFNGKEAFQLATNWKVFDQLLHIELKHKLDFTITHYFDIAEVEKSSNELKATKQANKWNWSEESNISLKPLYMFEWFANSAITHSIRATIYDYQYKTSQDQHEGSFLDFGQSDEKLRKRISNHRLKSVLDFSPIKNSDNPINNLQFSLSMDNELPPAISQNSIQSRAFFEFFRWSHDLSFSLRQNDENGPEFYAQPLSYISIYRPLEKLEFKNTLIYDFAAKDPKKDGHVEREEISFRAWWFSGELKFRHTQPYDWDKINLTWKVAGENKLLAEKATLDFTWTSKDYYWWKNRILFYFTFKANWQQDLIRYNRTSSLTLDFTFSFFIHEFLNFQLSYRMSNESLFLYYPNMKETLGLSKQRLFFTDLFNSISFWDEELLKKGLFKIKDLRFLAIHHLKDWDLIFEFVGKPKLKNNKLSWDYALGFYLRWIPIPLIKRRATFENETLRTDAR